MSNTEQRLQEFYQNLEQQIDGSPNSSVPTWRNSHQERPDYLQEYFSQGRVVDHHELILRPDARMDEKLASELLKLFVNDALGKNIEPELLESTVKAMFENFNRETFLDLLSIASPEERDYLSPYLNFFELMFNPDFVGEGSFSVPFLDALGRDSGVFMRREESGASVVEFRILGENGVALNFNAEGGFGGFGFASNDTPVVVDLGADRNDFQGVDFEFDVEFDKGVGQFTGDLNQEQLANTLWQETYTAQATVLGLSVELEYRSYLKGIERFNKDFHDIIDQQYSQLSESLRLSWDSQGFSQNDYVHQLRNFVDNRGANFTDLDSLFDGFHQEAEVYLSGVSEYSAYDFDEAHGWLVDLSGNDIPLVTTSNPSDQVSEIFNQFPIHGPIDYSLKPGLDASVDHSRIIMSKDLFDKAEQYLKLGAVKAFGAYSDFIEGTAETVLSGFGNLADFLASRAASLNGDLVFFEPDEQVVFEDESGFLHVVGIDHLAGIAQEHRLDDLTPVVFESPEELSAYVQSLGLDFDALAELPENQAELERGFIRTLDGQDRFVLSDLNQFRLASAGSTHLSVRGFVDGPGDYVLDGVPGNQTPEEALAHFSPHLKAGRHVVFEDAGQELGRFVLRNTNQLSDQNLGDGLVFEEQILTVQTGREISLGRSQNIQLQDGRAEIPLDSLGSSTIVNPHVIVLDNGDRLDFSQNDASIPFRVLVGDDASIGQSIPSGYVVIEHGDQTYVIQVRSLASGLEALEVIVPGGDVTSLSKAVLFPNGTDNDQSVQDYALSRRVDDELSLISLKDRIFFETPEFNDGPRDYVSIGAADWLNLPRDFVDGNLDNYQLAPIELFDSYSLGSGLDFTGLLDLGENAYFSERSAQSSLGKDYFWVRPTDSLALGSMQGLGDFSLSNLSGRADLTVQVADPALDVWTLFEQSSFVQDQSASIGSLSLQGLAGEDLGSLEFQLGDNIQLLQLRFGDDIALDPETFRILQNDDGTFTTVLQEGAELTVSSGETVLAQDLIDHTKQEATNVADFLFQELSSVFSKLQDVIFGSEDEVVEPGELSQFEQLQGEILGRLLLGESLDEIVEAVGNRLAGDLAAELVAVPLLNTLNIDPQSFAHGVAKASVAGFAVNVLQGEENLGEAAGDAVVTAAVTRALAKVNYGLNEGASSGIGDSGNSGLGESGNAAIAAAVTTLVLSLSKGGLGSENLEHSYKAAVSAAASQYVAHLVAVSLTPLFGPLGYAVGYAVGQALGDVVGVPVYNYVGNKLDAGKEVYDAFEDLLTGKDGFGQFAKDFGKALDDLLINAPKEFIQDLGKGIIDKFLGGYSKQSSTNTVASRTEVTAGGNSRIIGVRAEGALLQASQSGDDEILGTNGADVIVGRDGANVAAGFGGDDLLEGRDGDDALLGGSGDDHIEAGSGGDYIEGGDGDDKIYGDAGDDGILGGSGRDIVSGGSGNDQIEGGTDVDILYGGTGEDLILGGQGSDLIDGGAGDDILLGETENDKINGGEGSDQLDGGEGSDSLFGGDGADVIRGGSGNDFLAGESGIDVIHGDLGDDILEGGEGSDFLTGGFGNDLLIGDAGNDALFGEFGDDTLIAGAGGDTLEGGSGDDVLISGTENDDVLGGSGDDYYVFAQGDDIDTIIDTAGVQDVIKLENYSLDHMVFEQAENGKDLIIFVDFGTERLILENQLTDPSIEILVDHTGRAVDLSTLSFDSEGNASFTEIFFDSSEQDRKLRENYQSSVSASSLTNLLSSWYVDNFDLNILESTVDEEVYNDVQVKSRREKRHKWGGHYEMHYDYHESNIHGSDAAERIVGLWWAENIYANGGDDQVYGQHGDDDLYGGDGTDLLIGGSENDFIDGGQGTDKAFGSAGNDKIFGNVGNDALFGEWGDDTLEGGEGDDLLSGGFDQDLLTAGHGNDLLYGDMGNDTLIGNEGSDLLLGGEGNDVLQGMHDADTLIASEGADTLTGGGGSDLFVVTRDPGQEHVISDFDLVQNGEKIDLSAFALPLISNGEFGFEDLQMSQDGDDTVIDLGFGQTLRLLDIAMVDLVSSHFRFAQEGEFLNFTGDFSGGLGDDTLRGSLGAQVIHGSFGNDVLIASAGDDTIIGGEGDDTMASLGGDSAIMEGQGGTDFFVISRKAGASDEIIDFDAEDELIDLKAFAYSLLSSPIYGYDDIAMTDVAEGTMIELAEGQSLLLHGVSTSDLGEDNFLWGTSSAPEASSEAPILENPLPNYSASVGQAWLVDFPSNAFSDPQGDELSYHLGLASGAPLPSWLNFNPNNLRITGNPSISHIGVLNLRLTASDGVNSQFDIFELFIEAAITPGETISGGFDEELVIEGGSGDDSIISATDVANQLYGHGGNDTLLASSGGSGGVKTETLHGGAGHDLLISAHSANDQAILYGGSGSDVFEITRREGRSDVIMDFQPNALGERIDLSDFYTSLSGWQPFMQFADLQMSQVGGDVLIDLGKSQSLRIKNVSLSSLKADDFLFASQGTPQDDLISSRNGQGDFGGAGSDTLIGAQGSQLLQGGSGNDSILGSSGEDTLEGGSGNDTLRARGQGDDQMIMHGGSGADTFEVILRPNTEDQVLDFNPNQAGEVIDVRAFARQGISRTITEFSDLQIVQDGSDTVVDFGSGQTLRLKGVNSNSLNASHFLFSDLVIPENAITLSQSVGDIQINLTESVFVDLPDDLFSHSAGSEIALRLVQFNGLAIPNWLQFDPETLQITGTPSIKDIGVLSLALEATSAGDTLIEVFDLQVSTEQRPGIAVSRAHLQGGVVSGGSGDDTLEGASWALNELRGGAGNDYLYAVYGHSSGAVGTETLKGGAGHDVLVSAQSANDQAILYGESGSDVFQITARPSRQDVIMDFQIDAKGEKIDLSRFYLAHSGFSPLFQMSDLVLTQQGADTLIDLGEGQSLLLKNIRASDLSEDDFIFAGYGTAQDDLLVTAVNYSEFGGAGNDTIRGNYKSQILSGGSGDDYIEGNLDADTVIGGTGNDTLEGRVTFEGDEQTSYRMEGGQGDDLFILNQWEHIDYIIDDFEISNSSEKIDLQSFTEIDSSILQNKRAEGLDTVIDLSSTQSLRLKNVAPAALNASHFLFFVPIPELTLDEVQVLEEGTLQFDILGNDSDVLETAIITIETPEHGSFTHIGQGQIEFTPDADYFGEQTIGYTVDNGNGQVFTSEIIITVENVNDAPVAENRSVQMAHNETLELNLMSHIEDADGDDLIITVSGAKHGSAQVVDGHLIYEVDGLFSGVETLNYTVSDLDGASVTKQIELDIYIRPLELIGGALSDSLQGERGLNDLQGGQGDDWLWGHGGDDSLHGGGDDDVLEGGLGADHLDGGSGGDIASYRNSLEAVYIDLSTGESRGGDAEGDVLENIEHLFGTIWNDTLIGDDQANLFATGIGEDSVFGGGGNDTFVGFSDLDTFDGGSGHDTLILWSTSFRFYNFRYSVYMPRSPGEYGGYYNTKIINVEEIYGSTLNDRFFSGWHSAEFHGLAGNDLFYTGQGNDTFFGGTGADHFTLYQRSDVQTIIGDFEVHRSGEVISLSGFAAAEGGQLVISNEQVFYDAQNNQTVISLGDGQELILKNVRADQLRADHFRGVDYQAQFAEIVDEDFVAAEPDSELPEDLLSFVQKFVEVPLPVEQHGTDVGDALVGKFGDDALYGHGGNDTLSGGRGLDTLYGGSGDDVLEEHYGDQQAAHWNADVEKYYTSPAFRIRYVGSPGHLRVGGFIELSDFIWSYDVFDGGEGFDQLILSDANDWFEFDMAKAGQDSSSLMRLIDVEYLGAGAGDDLINLTSYNYDYGDIVIDGGEGDDILWDNSGDSTLLGGTGDDWIDGAQGDDQLLGGSGDDRVWGRGGEDTIIGGEGADLMAGFEGADTFVYESFADSTVDSSDTVFIFEQGLDVFDFRALGLSGFEDLLITEGDFTFGSSASGHGTQISVHGHEDFLINMQGQYDLVASDFLFDL